MLSTANRFSKGYKIHLSTIFEKGIHNINNISTIQNYLSTNLPFIPETLFIRIAIYFKKGKYKWFRLSPNLLFICRNLLKFGGFCFMII